MTLLFALTIYLTQLTLASPSAPPPPGKPEKEEKVASKGGKEHKIEREEEGRSPKRARTSTSASSTASTSASASSSASTAPLVSTAFAASPASTAPSASSSSSASTAAAAKEKETGALEPEEPPTIETPEVTLISKEGKTFKIPREVALDPKVSVLLSTAFEGRGNETTIPLPAIPADVLRLLSPVLWQMHHLLEFEAQKPINKRMGKAKVINMIADMLRPSTRPSQLVQFISAANFLDAPYLLEALLNYYASLLHHLEKQPHLLVAKIQRDDLGHDLLMRVSQIYTLRYFVDADPLLFPDKKTKTTIPLQIMVDYGLIQADFLKAYPNMGTKPNELQTDPRDPNPVGRQRKVPALARAFTNPYLVALLLKLPGIDVNTKDSFGDTVFGSGGGLPRDHEAAKKQVFESMRILLAAGFDPNGGRVKPLGIAAQDALPSTVELLLQHRANPNYSHPNSHTTALQKTFFVENDQNYPADRIAIARALIAARADIDAVDIDGETALLTAIGTMPSQSIDEIVQLFVDKGANLDLAYTGGEFEGETPLYRLLHMMRLHNSESAHYRKAVKRIIEGGARRNAVSANSEVSVSQLAQRVGDKEIIEMLTKSGMEFSQPSQSSQSQPSQPNS